MQPKLDTKVRKRRIEVRKDVNNVLTHDLHLPVYIDVYTCIQMCMYICRCTYVYVQVKLEDV